MAGEASTIDAFGHARRLRVATRPRLFALVAPAGAAILSRRLQGCASLAAGEDTAMPSNEKLLGRALWVPSGSPAAYLLATAISALAILLRIALDPYIEGLQVFALFPFVLLAAFLGDIGPGLWAMILCGLVTWYVIALPHLSWAVASRAEAHSLVAYFLIAPLGVVAVGALRRALDELRAADRRQRVLIAELQHRTRNLLGVVASTARQTLQASPSLEAFGKRYQGRLASLGRVQTLLSRGDERIELGELIRAELAVYDSQLIERRVHAAGPTVPLPAEAVQTLALAIHELATNAVRHGALAQPAGRLDIAWAVSDGRRPVVTIDWCESGVVPTDGTSTRGSGFGRQLIERALPYDLGAKTLFELTPEGVHCRIELPLGDRAA